MALQLVTECWVPSHPPLPNYTSSTHTSKHEGRKGYNQGVGDCKTDKGAKRSRKRCKRTEAEKNRDSNKRKYEEIKQGAKGGDNTEEKTEKEKGKTYKD